MKKIFNFLPLCLPVAVGLIFTFYLPRSYYIAPIEECDTFYNAANIAMGYPIRANWHPGTPVIYLTGWVFNLLGMNESNFVEQTQYFLHGIYIFISILTSICLWAFCRLVMKGWSVAHMLFVSMTALVAPVYFIYSNHIATSSYTAAMALLCIGLFLYLLGKEPTYKRVTILAIFLGLAISVKMTFAAVVGAILASYSCHILLIPASVIRSKISYSKRLRLVIWLFVSTSTFFLLYLFPIWSRLDELASSLEQREGYLQATPWSSIWPNLVQMFYKSYVHIGLAAIGVALLLALLCLLIRRSRLKKYLWDEGYNVLPAMLFCLLSIFFWLWTHRHPVPYSFWPPSPADEFNYWFGRRYSYPLSFFLPVLWFLVFRAVRGLQLTPSKVRSGLIGGLAITLFFMALGQHQMGRSRFIAKDSAGQNQMAAFVKELNQKDAVVGFMQSGEAPFGKEGFHFWGTIRYGGAYLLDNVQRHFPSMSYVNLRYMRYFYNNLQSIPHQPDASGYLIGTGKKRIRFKNLFSPVFRTLERGVRHDGLVKGVSSAAVLFWRRVFFYVAYKFEIPKTAEIQLSAGEKLQKPFAALVIRTQSLSNTGISEANVVRFLEERYKVKKADEEQQKVPHFTLFTSGNSVKR